MSRGVLFRSRTTLAITNSVRKDDVRQLYYHWKSERLRICSCKCFASIFNQIIRICSQIFVDFLSFVVSRQLQIPAMFPFNSPVIMITFVEFMVNFRFVANFFLFGLLWWMLESNLQTFPPSEASGKIAGGSRPPRDADGILSSSIL